MAGAESSEKPPVFSLRLLVDKKKNKVVLAEAGKEFVDVLFSFLTLPMGTIVRLLEKYQQDIKSQSTTIGCFNNLYKSVHDLGTASFMKEACKEMLLYPRSVKGNHRRGLKLNIDDTEFLKYYMCTKSNIKETCREAYSYFCSSRCSCGELMGKEVQVNLGVGYELFVSDKTLFTISDDLKVGFTSTGFTLKTLKGFGYTDVNQLHEMLVDVDHDKVVALMQCILSSDTPLTDVFLMKPYSCAIKKMHDVPNLALPGVTGGQAISVSVFTSKLDGNVLYVESGKDFVDFLFTFLVLPLVSTCEISGSDIVLGCAGNLCESFKSLSSSNTLAGKCVLPWYYSCQQPLLDVCYANFDARLRTVINSYHCFPDPMDPRGDKIPERNNVFSGFVKGGITFTISDDLIISPMNLSSTIGSLKKWNLDLNDIDEQVINISKTEAIRLLRASLMTSTALNTVFRSFLTKTKKPKEEKL